MITAQELRERTDALQEEMYQNGLGRFRDFVENIDSDEAALLAGKVVYDLDSGRLSNPMYSLSSQNAKRMVEALQSDGLLLDGFDITYDASRFNTTIQISW